jgi:hypothetical protein
MGKMQQRRRNVLRKKTGRLSVVFDERKWRVRDKKIGKQEVACGNEAAMA